MPKPREVGLEVELEDNPQPVPQVEDPLEGEEELEYQVVLPGEEEPETEEPQEEDPSAQELAALRAQLSQRESEGSTVAQGFAQLAETLKGIQNPAPAPQKAPQIDLEKMNSELKEKLYDNPIEALGQFYSTFVTPQLSAVEAKAKELDLKNERMDVALENPELFKTYASEIDETVRALGNAPGSYKRALSIVKGNHIDDIVEQKIQEALAKQAPAKVTSPSYTGVREMPVANPGTKKPVVRLTQEDLQEIELSPFTRDEWIRRYKMNK